MKATDLMINDIVQVHMPGIKNWLEKARIRAIDANAKTVDVMYKNKLYKGISIERVHEFRLTKEILDKNFPDTSYLSWTSDVSDFGHEWFDISVNWKDIITMNAPIHYIHELQHIMRECLIYKELKV